MRNVLYLRRTIEHQKESKDHKVIERGEAVPFLSSSSPHSQRYPLRESTDIGAKKKRKETLDTAEILRRK